MDETRWEQIKVQGDALAGKVKELLHESTVRRIVVKNNAGQTVMEIPVAAGVVAAIAAPVVSAVAAIAALASQWTIEIQRRSE